MKKNITYATNKENGPISPYKIISDVVTKSGCDFDNNYLDTSQRIDFITAQNMNVNETIQYCLNLGVSEKDAPMYFMTRLLDNKCTLINIMSLNSYSFPEANKFLSIATKEKKANTDIANFISHVESETPQGGVYNLDLLSTREFKEFNHNTRTWSQKIYTSKQLVKLLANISNTDISKYESVFFPENEKQILELNNYIKYYPNFSQSQMYKIFRDLELTTKNISFIAKGNLARDAGQLINLNTQNDTAKTSLNGPWIIYSCLHEWDGKVYQNSMVCYRTINQKSMVK